MTYWKDYMVGDVQPIFGYLSPPCSELGKNLSPAEAKFDLWEILIVDEIEKLKTANKNERKDARNIREFPKETFNSG